MYMVPLTKSGTKAANWKLSQNPGDVHRYRANQSIFRDIYYEQANNLKLLSETIQLLIFTHSKVQPGLWRTPQYLKVSISVGEIHQFYCVQCKHTDQ